MECWPFPPFFSRGAGPFQDEVDRGPFSFSFSFRMQEVDFVDLPAFFFSAQSPLLRLDNTKAPSLSSFSEAAGDPAGTLFFFQR